MKKLVSIFLVIVLLSLTLFSSCKPKDNAKPNEEKQPTVIEKISDAMDNVASYEIDGVASIELYVSSEKMELEENTKQIYAKSADGALYYYSSVNANMNFKGEETKAHIDRLALVS